MRCIAVAVVVVAVAAPAAQDWQIQETTDPLDDSRGITVALESPAGPTLIAGCVSGETRALISWRDYLGLGGRGIAPDDHQAVTIRVGSAEAVVWYLPISNDKTGTFINGGLRSIDAVRAGVRPWANTEGFLRALVQADRPTLAARTTPYNESAVTAVFDLSGAGEPVGQVAEACGWTLDASPLAPSVTETRRSDRERVYAEAERAFARGDMDAARVAYSRASDSGEPWAPPLFKLGLIALNDGNVAAALEYFEDVVRLAPGSAEGVQAAQVLQRLR